MNMMCLGLNYRSAPVSVRECFAVPKHLLVQQLQFIHALPTIVSCVLVSTCNRMELYYWSDSPQQATLQIQNYLFHKISRLRTDYDTYLYHKQGSHALHHLCQVMCGLDSMVLGETEIFGQIKTAYNTALNAGTTEICANKCFQKAFAIAKKVRSDSLIHSGATSVGSVAVELAEQIFGELAGRQVLILGAGEISHITGRALHARGAKSVYVANRSFERAQELASLIGGQAIKYDDWQNYLIHTDVVIAATAAPHYLITPQTLAPLRAARKYRSLFLIDISVPRNIDPQVNDIDEVFLYDIDTLTQLADRARQQRHQEIERCETLIRQYRDKLFPDTSFYES